MSVFQTEDVSSILTTRSNFQLGICIMVVQETLDLLVVVRFHHPLPILIISDIEL